MKQLNDLLHCVVLLSVFWIGLPLLPGGGESFAQPACEDSSLTDEDSHNADTDVDDDDDGLIEICNLEGLRNVRQNPAGTGYKTIPEAEDSTGCPTSGGCRGYELTADLNFTDTNAVGYEARTGSGWFPITGFNGVFEGNGHVIENLYINFPTTNKIGLFATIGTTGEVRNLGLTGNDMSVAGKSFVGALAGVVDGLVTSCYSTGAVRGFSIATASIGGLIGRASNTARVFNCHATGTVYGEVGHNIGGLVGDLAGTISNCYATGNVEGSGNARGGLIGFLDGGSVSNCYATGDVTGSGNSRGRLVGYGSTPSASISNCYATGTLTGEGIDVRHLVGQTMGSLRNSYWENMGAETSEDTRDRTSAQLKAFTQASTSDVAEGSWGTDDWDFGASSQYPALKSLDFDEDGTTRIQGYLLCGQPGDRAGCGVSIEATVDEATEGTDIFFVLIRKGRATVTAGDLTVSVMVSDGDGDFLASDELDLTVVIPEGNSIKDFIVMTLDDAEGEADGILTATVSTNPAYEVAEPSSATVVIEDDDLPVVSIVKTTDAVEGDGTSAVSAVFTVSRDETNTAPLDVKVGLAFSEDFSSSETSSEPTVTINAGDTSVTLTVGVMDNNIDQEEGTITATLVAVTSVPTYRISKDSPVATAAITDDELPVVSIVKITDAKEGDGTSAVSAMFTVSRIGLTTNPLDVEVGLVFSDGFSSSVGISEATVTINANENSAALEVGVADNDMDQADGTITATLVVFTPATYQIVSSTAEATITDDDPPSITSFAIGASSSSVIDEAAKLITVTVPQGTALTNVKPVVVTVHSDAAVTPSGAQTFTVDVAVPYTVTDGDTPVTYQVTVEEAAGIPPGVPAGFSAAAGIEEVTLSWTPPAQLGTDGMLSRYEYRQTQGATVSGWVAVDPTATMQVVGSLTAGAVYGFEVRAVGSRGLPSDPTTKKEATPLAAPVPTFGDKTIANQTYTENMAIMNLVLPEATDGTGALTYSLSPTVPGGLSFDANTRMLTGTPMAFAPATQYTYTVTDGGNPVKTATLTFTITVNAEGTPTFEDSIEHQTYTKDSSIETLTLPLATGGTGTLTYTLIPALPNGLSFDTDTRMLKGIPDTAASATQYTYTVTDASSNEASLTFTITVIEPDTTAPVFSVPTLDDLVYTLNTVIAELILPAATDSGALTYTLTPPLPSGLSLAAGRTLSGTPDTPQGVTEYTYKATDTSGNEASLTFTITVNAARTLGAGGGEVVVGVYPNPSGDALHVELPFGGFYKISVLTLTGQAALGERQVGGGSRTLNLSSLKGGVYFLKVEDGEGISQTFRIIR